MKTYYIVDGSYALANIEGKMKPISGNELFCRRFSILATGCDLPAGASINFQRNNTIVVAVYSGQIVFTQWRFLRKMKNAL